MVGLNVEELGWQITYLQGWTDCLARLEDVMGACKGCHAEYVKVMGETLDMIKAPRPVIIAMEKWTHITN